MRFLTQNIPEVVRIIVLLNVSESCMNYIYLQLINLLLEREPEQRAGTGGAYEVKEHPFFHHVNWNSLLREKAEFVPVLDDEEDTSYFDSELHTYPFRLRTILIIIVLLLLGNVFLTASGRQGERGLD